MASSLSAQTIDVLAAFLEAPSEWRWGADISRACGLKSGTIYPMLARLEGRGWLESRWERIDPSEEGRPARRYYRLTASGATAVTTEVEAQLRRLSRVPHGRARRARIQEGLL